MPINIFQNLDVNSKVQECVIIENITHKISLKDKEDIIGNFDKLVWNTIEYVISLYYSKYRDQLSYDILITEATSLVNLILFILFSSHLFQIKDSKFIYEKAYGIKKDNMGVKTIIYNILEATDICENFYNYEFHYIIANIETNYHMTFL